MIRRLILFIIREDIEKIYSYIDTIIKKINEIEDKISTTKSRFEKISTLTREVKEINEKLQQIEDKITRLEQLTRKHNSVLKDLLKR